MKCRRSATANKLSVINSSRQFLKTAKISKPTSLPDGCRHGRFLLATSSASPTDVPQSDSRRRSCSIKATATFFLLRRTLNIGHFRLNPPLKQSGCRRSSNTAEQGYLLLGLLFIAALLLIALAMAAPEIGKQIQREKEAETIHRGEQYKRAIKLYYRKFGSYPSSIKQLKETNKIRFLRQDYVDPMTGKKDWKFLHLGQVQMISMGFFGKPLQMGGVLPGGSQVPGMPGSGLPGSTNGASSSIGNSGVGNSNSFGGGSSFGSSGTSSFGSNSSSFGGNSSSFGSGMGSSSFGSNNSASNDNFFNDSNSSANSGSSSTDNGT